MKNILLLVALFCVTTIHAQDFPLNNDGEVEFTEVVEVGLSKDKLHANAKEWIAKTFGDYKKVIQFEDNENCKLIIKGISNISHFAVAPGMATRENVSYIITIESKDNKYRYKINDILVNQKMTMLGTPVNLNPFVPIKHLKNISGYNKELDELKLIDVSKMKNKTLQEHQNKIANIEKNISDEITFYNQEYAAIVGIIDSLKKSMVINDDF